MRTAQYELQARQSQDISTGGAARRERRQIVLKSWKAWCMTSQTGHQNDTRSHTSV